MLRVLSTKEKRNNGARDGPNGRCLFDGFVQFMRDYTWPTSVLDSRYIYSNCKCVGNDDYDIWIDTQYFLSLKTL